MKRGEQPDLRPDLFNKSNGEDRQGKNGDSKSKSGDIEFPLRERGDRFKFFLILFVLPAFCTAASAGFFAWLSFPQSTVACRELFQISLYHFAFLLVFLLMLWGPVFLAIPDLSERLEMSLVIGRSVILIAAAFVLFPHQLIAKLLESDKEARPMFSLYLIFFGLFLSGYFILAIFNNRRTAFRDVRMAKEPQGRKYPDRWLWFEASSTFLVLLAVIVIEIWFLAAIGKGQFDFHPYDDLAEARWLPWLCCGVLCAFIFFLWACLPNRLMKATLIPLTFQERDVQGVIFKSYRYLYHFARAMMLKYPLLLIGGISLTLIFLATPAVLINANPSDPSENFITPDVIILALAVFISWFIPISLAVVMPDETFGEYFNRRLANHVMMVQGHLVFIGYGDLGKRVLDRVTSQMWRKQQKRKEKKARKAGKEKPEKMFFEVVTPDLRLEQLCSHAVVIERDPKNVIYSGKTNLLGDYGVVSTCERTYFSRDGKGNKVSLQKRVLMPVVIGEAKEPFVSSRVNLERANLVISTVPDEESVQAIFKRVKKAEVPAIVCVTHSDQISYLTYLSHHRSIVLIYPKDNQGIALGQRLWTAILKVRAVRNMPQDIWPHVLVIGNNKANYYMMATLWTNLPADRSARKQILEKNVALIVTSQGHLAEYPVLKNTPEANIFDRYWSFAYDTGSRLPYASGQAELTAPIHIPASVITAVDSQTLEACLRQHHPDILVINHEEVEESWLVLARCMRALERLKTRNQKFQFPLLFLTAVRGDVWEQKSLGDASNYYDALCKSHNDDLARDLSYPWHAHYDRSKRVLIGESITDSLADVEEIIYGAGSSFLDATKPKFIEINACLPNRPGTLANYVAKLAGIEFTPAVKAEIDKQWQQVNELPAHCPALLPSFQYLRDITFDPERRAFALTGYATLASWVEDANTEESRSENTPLVVRVFANDGEKYPELHDVPNASPSASGKTPPNMNSPATGAPNAGVPNAIDRLTARAEGAHNTVADFQEVLLDPQPENQTGKYACPGMTICRIAAFQNYVVASNPLPLQRLALAPNDPDAGNEKLLHARNYYCCTGMRPAGDSEVPNEQSPYARIFCCCHEQKDEPGMIATILNTLLFRVKSAAPKDSQNNWVININSIGLIKNGNLTTIFQIFPGLTNLSEAAIRSCW